MATMYKFPNRKKVKTKKVPHQELIEEVLAAKPREICVLAYCEDGSIIFFGDGQSQAAILWLFEMAKDALLDGELSGPGSS